jgi:hypothetical protein
MSMLPGAMQTQTGLTPGELLGRAVDDDRDSVSAPAKPSVPLAPAAVPDGASIGFSEVDSMAIRGLPDSVQRLAAENLTRLATDLAREGARGGAMRRLLSRHIAIGQVRIRHLQCIQGVQLRHIGEGDSYMRVAADLDKMIESEYRRLLAAIDTLARCDPSPVTATVQISANQAAVVVGR